MATISIERNHTLPLDQARAAIEKFEGDLKRYGLKTEWNGNVAQLKGTGASGEIRIDQSKVKVEIKLGLLAKAAGIDPTRVQASIEKRLDAALK